MDSRNPPISPEDNNALINQGLSYLQQGRLQEALETYQRALSADPNHFEALQGIGILSGQMGRFEEALKFFTEASAVQPNNFAVHFNRGKALKELKRYPEALAAYDKALSLKPDFAEAYNNRGTVLKDLRRYDEALSSFNKAIALKPGYTNAYNNQGATLVILQRHDEALASYDKALSLNPAYAEAYNNRGTALEHLRRYDEALASYDKAIDLKPDFAKAYNNRGIVFSQFKQHQEAIVNFDKAIALDPDLPYIYGNRLYTQMCIDSWEDFDNRVDTIVRALQQDVPASSPFPLLAVPVANELLLRSAELFVADECPPVTPALWQGERYSHERIRLGYFSADFHNHATAHLMAELFEKHDRTRFEVLAFSFGPVQHDAMRQRLVEAFDQFFEVSALSNQAIAALARQQEIDIAVDLKGYTQDCRPGIFALRPAPIQVNYLGFPGTMGAPYIDYLIADAVVVPSEHFAFYSEKVVHLPHCYQVNDSKRRIADAVPSRAALGLPEAGFVFCCFNNNFKITPDVFTVWMRLLAQVPGSVLWLLEGHASIRHNLSREAQLRGIDPARLVFAPRMNLPEHLARHRRADLFLDTFYYNAHTTTSDALWAGLPVLTCLGETFAGRVAASCLAAVGLPELITHRHDDYEALALKLARNPDALAAVKRKLLHHQASHPLFNTALFTQHIEQAFSSMYQRHLQNLPPHHFNVGP